MRRLGEWIGACFPRRRLRSWRYVSPRRRGAGVVVLFALACGLYAYFSLTNDRVIRQQAQAYLAELTGGDWRVHGAHFSLFGGLGAQSVGGIELKGVELRVPGQAQPFFSADVVHLRHQSWDLLVRQRLDVREIHCEGAAVRLTYDEANDVWVYPKLRFSMGGGGGAGARANVGAWWPPLGVQRASVVFAYLGQGLELERVEAQTEIQGFSRPDGIYQMALLGDREDSDASLRGSVQVNMNTGQVVAPAVVLQDVALLQHLSKLKKLGIRGRVTVSARWDPVSGQGSLDANFDGGAMVLPPEFEGLHLHSVRGLLCLDPNGVSLRGLSGRLAEGGDGRFTVSGRFEGFDANSPFDFHVAMEGLELPQRLDGNGPLATAIRYLREHYLLKGRLRAAAHLVRGRDGRLHVEGTADANDLTAMDDTFPYELRAVEANVAFTDDRLEFRSLQAAHGSARIQVAGVIRFPPAGGTYDLMIRSRDLTIDEDLKSALGTDHRRLWDLLSPRGKLGVRVRAHMDTPGGAEKQDVAILFGGAASVEYSGFPYRIENVYGEAQLVGNDITLSSISCESPQMSCTVDGTIRLGSDLESDANLTIRARLPLDERLAHALGPDGQSAYDALRPSGMAQNVLAQVWKHGGEPIGYHVRAEVAGASFTFDRFPYSVTDANGLLIVDPNCVTISRLSGRHRDTPITMSGEVYPGKDGAGAELQVDASAVRIDQELFDAVPAFVQRAWKQLSPAGLADVGFHLRWKALSDPNLVDYTCRVLGRDVSLKYANFPYTLRGLRGSALVTPDRVELQDVTSSDGNVKLSLSGVITAGEKEDRAELSLRAQDVPMDSDLIAALPLKTTPFFTRLKPGGTCSLNLSRLVLVSEASAAGAAAGEAARAGSSPASAGAGPGGRSASSPAPPLSGPIKEWLLDGEIALKEAGVDLGAAARLTGGLSGQIARGEGGLHIDANLLLESLAVSQRVMTDVRGRMWKEPNNSLIHIDDILGKAYGGRLAGFAEIRMGEPLEYGFRVIAEKMNLNDVFNASVTDANQRTPVEGLLDATIEMKASEGAKPERHVSGLLHLSKAKVQKVPVLVDQIQPVLLAVPGDSFSEGVVEYTLKEGKVLFREIHLRGPALSIVGSGTMNLKNEALKLTFLSRPGILPRLDNLGDELLEGVLRELGEIQVTGTLKNPKFKSTPLRSVDAVVGKLLRPDAE
jgi:hypothetical protein